MKILSFNVGYFLGFQAQRQWIRRPHRLLVESDQSRRSGIEGLVEVIDEEQPDVVALQEVDQGSIRSKFSNHCTQIIRELRTAGHDYNYRIDTKYGRERLVARLPILRNMGNALLWNEGKAEAHYLSNGTKRLVHVLDQDHGPTVMGAHLSKTKQTRERQLNEIATLVENYESVVLTGDFNVKSRDEFDVLTDSAGFELHIPGNSFSTAYPTYPFDVFLTSESLTVSRCEVLEQVQFSDHMPVVAEVIEE